MKEIVAIIAAAAIAVTALITGNDTILAAGCVAAIGGIGGYVGARAAVKD